MEDINKMSKKDDKLDKILECVEELTRMIVNDLYPEDLDDRPEWMEEAPSEAIQAFRITERVVREMREQFGEEWMDHMGIT